MTIYRFRAHALTPVHIGSGWEIDPTEFTIHENQLLHFSPTRVLNSLGTEDAGRLVRLLSDANLNTLQSFLRSHLDPENHGIEKIDVSKGFKDGFTLRASAPDSRFRVFMMPRNDHLGQVYMPGSSIKGAIRTAVVNHFANIEPGTRNAVREALRRAPDRDRAETLEASALNRSKSQTERDVFRLVDVEDVALPENSTRIDRVVNVHPDRQGPEGIQIWVERMKARSESSQPPSFSVALHIDTRAMEHERVRSLLGRTLDIDTIIKACNRFYWKRMVSEAEKFDGKSSPGDTTWKALYSLFPRGRKPDGDIVAIEPSKPYWCTTEKKRMLMRVGRFSHFESLSVDEHRQGWNVQARRPITDMGATRSRCVMENGLPPMPFGWILLSLEE
jgi:CRISPR-associated protein Csm5